MVMYDDFCKTLTLPKYLLDIMREKNRVQTVD